MVGRRCIEDSAVCVPVLLADDGVARVEWSLAAEERAAMRETARAVREAT
jgi:malate/lactate dehydrogenase